MCHGCVMDRVKQRMLDRRDFFRKSVGAVAAVGAAGGTMALAPDAFARRTRKVVDLTHTLTTDFPTYFGVQHFFEEQKFHFAEHGFNLKEIRVNEHTGTHLDAPLHFSADGYGVDEIPVRELVVPLVVVDIRSRASDNPDTLVTPDDIKAWTQTHGDLPQGSCVAMNSGWGRYARSSRFRNVDADDVMHFPGFHVETAQMLMEKQVVGLAVDTLSLDHGPSTNFATHYAWLPSNRWGLECVANLDELPARGATLVVGSPKHAGGTGGPSRVFALM